MLLIMTICSSALADELTISLISIDENDQYRVVGSDGLIPWGNGSLSFDVVCADGAEGYPDGVTASISYYAKTGRTSEEVLGWELVLNNHADAPIHCDIWFAFPAGEQTNYTNPVAVRFEENVFSCRLVPVLAEGLSPAQFPDVIGILSDDSQVENENADSEGSLLTGSVSRGSVTIPFRYPDGCEYEDEGSIGTLVHLNETDYVSLMIPKGKLTGTAAVHDYIGDSGEVTELSDRMNVFAVHGDENHRMPYLDVVEVGVNLPTGDNVIICAYSSYGNTAVYDLLMTIVHSMLDAEELDAWLVDTWIPFVVSAN